MGKRIAPAIGLFLLSPLIGEFLLGNLPVTMLFALITLAPLYGGGALLIRELARRRGVGWPGIVLLAVAYALLEEGLVTRSLFNPGYAGMDLTQYAWLPGIGVSAWWTAFVLGGVHAVGSICVPIAVMEATTPARATEPWLRLPGLVVAGVLFVLGAVGSALVDPAAHQPSVTQLAIQLAAVLLPAALLILLALRIRPPATRPSLPASAFDSRSPLPASAPDGSPLPASAPGGSPLPASGSLAESPGRAPGPWVTLGFSLVAAGAFWAATLALDALGAWLVLAIYLAVYAVAAVLVTRWSRRPGWGPGQRFALAAGGVLTYAWHGFPQPPAVPVAPEIDLAGNAAFALAAVTLLCLTATRLRRAGRSIPSAAPAGSA
ncbi:hypothetical protein [Nonomuraea candida]|uniref:hypothetical protein n=1 Tax=Nonomuraea candida TaxID=359159 RepID=UPI000693CB69|nr:hypothetical protein [Nonomuraea candida]